MTAVFNEKMLHICPTPAAYPPGRAKEGLVTDALDTVATPLLVLSLSFGVTNSDADL